MNAKSQTWTRGRALKTPTRGEKKDSEGYVTPLFANRPLSRLPRERAPLRELVPSISFPVSKEMSSAIVCEGITVIAGNKKVISRVRSAEKGRREREREKRSYRA